MSRSTSAIFLILLQTSQVFSTHCTGVHYNERYHEVEILKEGINHVNQIVYNHYENSIYYIFYLLNELPIYTSSVGYTNLDYRDSGIIKGLINARAIAVDQVYNVLYVGCADGMYKVTRRKDIVKIYAIEASIISMFFRNALYYTTSKREAYKYVESFREFNDGYTNLVPEIATECDGIAIDDDDNIFFTQDYKIYRVKIGTMAVNTHENYTVHYMTTDHYNHLIIGTKDGVYRYNKIKYSFDKMSDLKNVKAMAFNRRNEPIYFITGNLIKLHFKHVPCYD